MAVQRYEMLVSKLTWYLTHFYIMNCTTYSGFTNKTDNTHVYALQTYFILLTIFDTLQ